MNITIVCLIGLLLGCYIMLEAIDDAGRYSGPDRCCLVFRDVATGVAGLMLLWYAAKGQIDWLHVALGLPLALFLWPKMVMRLRRIFRPLEFWE